MTEDRGGLDAAIELGIPHGGWCPKGRLAEDGLIPAKYQQKEMPTKDYIKRTEQNVIDSTATIVACQQADPGGLRTSRISITGGPCLWADLDMPLTSLKTQILAWMEGLGNNTVLNVAGSRESKAPGIERKVKEVMIETLKQ